MTEHVPPQKIIDLFETEDSAFKEGRHAYIQWIKSLGHDFKTGDTIWVPGAPGEDKVGWWRKESAGQQ